MLEKQTNIAHRSKGKWIYRSNTSQEMHLVETESCAHRKTPGSLFLENLRIQKAQHAVLVCRVKASEV